MSYVKLVSMTNKKNTLWIGLLAIIVLIAFGLVYVANRQSDAPKKEATSSSKQQGNEQASNQPTEQKQTDLQVFTDLAKPEKFDAASVTELKVEELKAGTGDTIAETDTISANYSGWNAAGTIFDTTKKSADATPTPIEFPLSGVIPGWTKGLAGKKVGGIYKLMIPADMAYGDRAPSKDTSGPLAFVVEIVAKK